MKRGFMLVELIIATLIASMVAGVLFAALFQSSRVQTSVDTIIDLSVRVGVVANQLEKDLMGAFICASSLDTSPTGILGTSGKDQNDKQQNEQKTAQNVPAKEAPKPIEKIFYSTNKNGQLDTLTFVTNNPLVVYVGADVGVVKPKVARVQYTLKPEAEKKNSYALFRQESTELDVEKYKNVTPYEVIGGIKNCTMTFTARIEKKESSSAKAPADSANAPEKKSYEYKTQNEWVSEQKKEDKDNKEKSEFPRIPYSVEMKLVLWDIQEKKEKEFTIVCEIPTDFSPPKQQDKKEPYSAEATKGKPEKPQQDEKEAESSAENIPQATKVASNTKEIFRLVDQTVKIEADKTDKAMNEIMKMFGRT